MAMTINPAVGRVPYKRWLAHVAFFAAGVSAGAFGVYFAIHGVARLLASVSPIAWLVVAVPILTLAALRDLGAPAPVPYRNGTQVPEWLRRVLPPGAAATVYGGQLGAGFFTSFTYSTHTAFVALLATQAQLGWVSLAIVTFACGKSIVLFTSVAPKADVKFQDRFERRLPSHGFGILRLANAALASVTAVILIVA
jgi:hypothetical protein